MIFATDLDRTLIYSNKFLNEAGSPYKSIEIYKEKPISYISLKSLELLTKIKQKAHIIPVTTRNYEQYHRIEVFKGELAPELYIINNGGTIYIQGKEDIYWKQHIENQIRALKRGYDEVLHYFLESYKGTIERHKKSDELIWLILGDQNQIDWEAVKAFEAHYAKWGWKIDVNGRKIYLYPEFINKWDAINYVRNTYFVGENIIAAGDSLFDYEMVHHAKWGIVPKGSWIEINCKPSILRTSNEGLQAGEEILENVLEIIDSQKVIKKKY